MTGFSNKPFPQNKALLIYRGKFSRLSGHSQKKEKFWGDDPALGKCHLNNNAQWHQAVESIWNNETHCTPAVPRLPPLGKKYFGAILKVLQVLYEQFGQSEKYFGAVLQV